VDARSRTTFLLLVLAQAAHSLEEIYAQLGAVFAPSRAVASLFSDDPATGFAIANALIVGFGAWCYGALVRRDAPSARGLAWGWVAVELGNGIGHSLFALGRGGYFPGVATAPLLFGIAAYLAAQLVRQRQLQAEGLITPVSPET
jgi:hypothetical protein